MNESLEVSKTATPGQFRTADGRLLAAPEGWVLLPPGDATLTRRVKQAGPSWSVVEKRGRKLFSHGVWAPAARVEAVRAALELERSTPAYARRREAGGRRREQAQADYETEFEQEVLTFLAFAPTYQVQARALAHAVRTHATPVGSGTVARTKRIPVERRAEAAVLAWLRHQTTAYDRMKVARVKGERRRVRRELAAASRRLLDRHRRAEIHPGADCPLCARVAESTAEKERSLLE